MTGYKVANGNGHSNGNGNTKGTNGTNGHSNGHKSADYTAQENPT